MAAENPVGARNPVLEELKHPFELFQKEVYFMLQEGRQLLGSHDVLEFTPYVVNLFFTVEQAIREANDKYRIFLNRHADEFKGVVEKMGTYVSECMSREYLTLVERFDALKPQTL